MKQQKQSGFAHLMIITVIMGLGLVGTLGFVFWQNFMQPKDVAKTSNSISKNETNNKIDEAEVVSYNTYTTDQYNISFQYPNSWSIKETQHGGGGYYGRNVEIKNVDGETIANFAVGMQLGGRCDIQSNYTVIDSAETKFQSNGYTTNGSQITKSVSLSFTVIENGNNGYGVHYGLTDEYTTLGETGKVCSNTFYYSIHPDIDGIVGLSFGDSIIGGLKNFSSIEDAKEYINSDEYKAIKKMILSLTY